MARKYHNCEDCGRPIAPGEQYHRATGLYDGYFFTNKVCAHCWMASDWILRACGYRPWHEGGEELREHWDEEWDLRSLGLGRLILLHGRRWRINGELVALEDLRRIVDVAVDRIPVKARAAA